MQKIKSRCSISCCLAIFGCWLLSLLQPAMSMTRDDQSKCNDTHLRFWRWSSRKSWWIWSRKAWIDALRKLWAWFCLQAPATKLSTKALVDFFQWNGSISLSKILRYIFMHPIWTLGDKFVQRSVFMCFCQHEARHHNWWTYISYSAVKYLFEFRDKQVTKSEHWKLALEPWRCPTDPGLSDQACDPCGMAYQGNWKHIACRGFSNGKNISIWCSVVIQYLLICIVFPAAFSILARCTMPLAPRLGALPASCMHILQSISFGT